MRNTVSKILQIKIHTHLPRTLGNAKALVYEALPTVLHKIRRDTSQVTGYLLGVLAFHRNMLLDVILVADLMVIRQGHQLSGDENLRHTNAKQSSYNYKVGQEVLKKRHKLSNIGKHWDEPFAITQVHVNINITIEL